jgi:RNA polymerase sigma factor (sigma-70 family)
MLGSREDAEDVVQETFAAAYGAMVADDRPINVKPWLYRIARNRALNHMRRQSAVGVDSFEHHMADNGLTTDETVHKREEFRQLMADVRELPETQRTALLLREIDALSYDQIAEAMETTVPSVKSLLVRARVSLAEAAEARKLSCDEVREELGEVAEGLARLSPPARRHLRDCERCAGFRKSLRETNRALALMLPIGPLLILKKLMLAQVGTTASAGGGAAASAATTTAAGAAAGSAAGGAVSAGMTAIASKAAATVAAAAIVTAGAVEVDQTRHASPQRAQATFVAAAPAPAASPSAKTATPPVVAQVKKATPTNDTAANETKPAAAEPTAQPAPAAVVPATPVPSPVVQPAPEPVAPAAPEPPVQIAPEEQVDVVTLPPSQESTPPATTPAEETLPEQPPAEGTTGPAEEPSTPPSGTTGPTGPTDVPVTPPATTTP